MRLLITPLLLILSLQLSAQELQIMVPVQIDNDVISTEQKHRVEFYEMPYSSDSISLKAIKRVYPKLRVPDYVKIDAPDLSGFQDTMVLFAAIDQKEKPNDLIIWLAGDYNTNKVTFFIDRTLDRNFNNDGKPTVIKPNHGNVKVEYKPRGKKRRSFVYLSVPRKEIETYSMKRIKVAKIKERIVDQFSLELMAGTGVGENSYNYNNTDFGYPSWYNVKFSVKTLGFMLNYDFHNWRFGLGLQYLNLFYYTSYRNVRYGEDELIMTNNGYRTLEKVIVDRNLDVKPVHIFQYSALLAYKLKLSSNMVLQPNAIIGFSQFAPGEYQPNRLEPESALKFGLKRFLELGTTFEFTVGKDKAVFLGASVSTIDWEPNGFRESLPQQNFESSFNLLKLKLGYRLGF